MKLNFEKSPSQENENLVIIRGGKISPFVFPSKFTIL